MTSIQPASPSFQRVAIVRRRLWNVLAAGMLLVGPLGLSPSPAFGQSYEDLVARLNDTEREIRENDERFARETAGMNRGSRTYRDLQRQRDEREREIRSRRVKLKEQVDRSKASTVGKAGDRLENVGDAIENEKKRHAEAMKKLPAGSAAAQIEAQRHEDRLRELRTRRDDVKQDVASARQATAAGEQFKRDSRTLAAAIDSEKKRHERAMRYLPANSPQAQEEERFHQQRLREINSGVEAAADRRDLTVAGVQADKAVDGELDNVNTQIAQEQARHQRRMAQVFNGSAAHAEELRQHQDNMARLTGRKAELENRSASARSAAQQQFALKRQLDQIDQELAAENARFQRRLNDVQAGSEIERLERQRNAQVLADLNARRSQVVAQLNNLPATASGR
jgi:hypothetical protein